MTKQISILVLAMSLTLAIFAKSKAEEVATKVEFAQLPAAAKQAVTSQLQKVKGKLDEINLVKEETNIWYEVDFTQGKRDRSFTISVDGKLLSWQVFMGELPVPVRTAINQRFETPPHKEKIGDINRVFEEDAVTYEVELQRGTNEFTCTFSEAGKVFVAGNGRWPKPRRKCRKRSRKNRRAEKSKASRWIWKMGKRRQPTTWTFLKTAKWNRSASPKMAPLKWIEF